MLASKGAAFKNVVKQTHISLVYACILKKKKKKDVHKSRKSYLWKMGTNSATATAHPRLIDNNRKSGRKVLCVWGRIKKGNMQTMLSCFSEQGRKYFHININADVMQISLYLEVTLVGYSVTTLRFRSVSCQQNITLTFLYYFYFVL